MKKIFVWAAVSIAVLTGAAYAQGATLWQFYQDKGQSLPTVSSRSADAARCGIFFYKGTVEQNKALLECLKFEESLKNVPNVDGDVIFGANPVTRYQTTLSSSMTSSQSTVSVSSITTFDGTILTSSILGGEVYLSLEAGSSKEEIIRCTGISGSTFTGCTRGLAFSGTSTTSVSANQKSHNAGSVVIMSNVHYIYNTITKANQWTEIQTFASSTDSVTQQVNFGTSTPSYFKNLNGILYYCNYGFPCATIGGGANTYSFILPLLTSGNEVKFASSTYDFAYRDNLFALATSTIGSGTASGKAIDDNWNARYNATSTKSSLTISDDLTVGGNLSVGTIEGSLKTTTSTSAELGTTISGDSSPKAVFMSRYASSTAYQYGVTVDDVASVFGVNYQSQLLPTTTSAFTKFVGGWVYVTKVGNGGGNFTVAIRAVGTNGKPTGSDLAAATVAASGFSTSAAIYQFSFSSSYTGSVGTKYALIFYNSGGDGSNYIKVGYVTNGTYDFGGTRDSTDSGSTWGNGLTGEKADYAFGLYDNTLSGELGLSSSGLNDYYHNHFLGFATDNTTNGLNTVQIEGIVTGLSGLTRGATYYVGTSGSISSTAGAVSIIVGQAMSPTTLLIARDYSKL